MKRGNYKVADPTAHVSCRVQVDTLSEMKEIGKPGGICSAIIRQFYPLKKILKTLNINNQITSDNGHVIYFTYLNNKILMHIKKNDMIIPLELTDDIAYQLVVTLMDVVKSR